MTAAGKLVVRLVRDLQSQADDDLRQLLLWLVHESRDHGVRVFGRFHAALHDDEELVQGVAMIDAERRALTGSVEWHAMPAGGACLP